MSVAVGVAALSLLTFSLNHAFSFIISFIGSQEWPRKKQYLVLSCLNLYRTIPYSSGTEWLKFFESGKKKGYAKVKQFQNNHFNILNKNNTATMPSPNGIILILVAFLIPFCWTKEFSVVFEQEWNLIQKWLFIKLNLQ